MSRFSPGEQAAIVAANPAFSRESALWYVAARAAYRQFDFKLTRATGEQALRSFNIPPDSLPATTDPDMIKQVIEKSLPKEALNGDAAIDEVDLLEIPYVVEASKEFMAYDACWIPLAGSRPTALPKNSTDHFEILPASLTGPMPRIAAAARFITIYGRRFG